MPLQLVEHVTSLRNDMITRNVVGRNYKMSGCKTEQSKNYKAP